jgi:hypothetical protein
VQIEDLEELPLYCLADTGALDNRFGAEVAEVAGISLVEPLDEGTILVGGLRINGRCQRVDLTIAGHRFEAPVWFCEPWPFAFGLLGQEGFFRFFRATIAAAEDWLECVPEPVDGR